jgi:ABC-type multidrug transport system fused ATPase/permease subunit
MVMGQERAIGALAFNAILSGVTEVGVLAVVAQVAASLLSGAEQVHVRLLFVDVDLTIWNLLVIGAALSIVRIGLQAQGAWLQARLASDVMVNLRKNLFAAFTRASWGLQSSEREGHLQEMMTSQAMQSTGGMLQLASFISALLTFLVLVISAMLLNFIAAAIIVVVALALVALLRPLSKLGRRSARELSRAQLNFAGGVNEAVRMAEETQVFGVGQPQRSRIDEFADRSGGLYMRTQFVSRFVPALFQCLIYLTVIVGLGAMYATSVGDVASLGAVVLMMVRAGTYGQQAQGSYQAMIQALPFIERLLKLTERYEGGVPHPGNRPLESLASVSFVDVSYSYRPGEPVLQDINFEVARGDTVGVVGPSGAGKSTLVQLLLRLRDPQRGAYEINGVPAAGYAPADWHRRIAYVPQKPQLLHATVTENIRFYRDIDHDSVRRAARLARIDGDIDEWSNGYDTIIGPRADSISGGQQQRICLARALAAVPEMLVLDEPTSALDPRSEQLVQASLAEIAAELTLFIVTHRMTMLSVCDKLLVMVDGRVDDFGNTHRLTETNTYFTAA